MKSLAVSSPEKRLDLEEFFVPNKRLIRIKESIIQLLKELVKDKMIHNKVEIVFKSGKKKEGLIKMLTASDITRRIKYIKFHEIFKKDL